MNKSERLKRISVLNRRLDFLADRCEQISNEVYALESVERWAENRNRRKRWLRAKARIERGGEANPSYRDESISFDDKMAIRREIDLKRRTFIRQFYKCFIGTPSIDY